MIVDNLKELARISADLRARGKTIVTTNGVFDIVHRGHIHLFEEAKKYGDYLFIGVNSDASVKRYKGEKRPIISELDRAYLVNVIRFVDYVTIFDEDVPLEFLRAVKPNIHVLGQNFNDTAKRIPEIVLVEDELGGSMKYTTYTPHSSTDIIKKILRVYGDG